jgi:hypothetical protein
MAWAFFRCSSRYAPEYVLAWIKGEGVHAHRCVLPWEWRAQKLSRGGEIEVTGWVNSGPDNLQQSPHNVPSECRRRITTAINLLSSSRWW